MKRSRCTEDQIIGILKEHEAGVSVADLCRTHGVSLTLDKGWGHRHVCRWLRCKSADDGIQ